MKPRIISPCTAERYSKLPHERIAEFSVNGAGGLFAVTDAEARGYRNVPLGTKAVVELYRLDDTIAVRVDPDRLDLGEADRAKLLARYGGAMLEAMKLALPVLEDAVEDAAAHFETTAEYRAESQQSLDAAVAAHEAVKAAIAGAPAAAPDESRLLPSLDDGEIGMILAALRLAQRQGLPGDLEDIATNGGAFDAIGDDEIDALCERLNCGEGDANA